MQQGRIEWLTLSVPVRVIGASPGTGQFTEDAHTVAVNQAGSRIELAHPLSAGQTVRIVNLENYKEADFRVVGPMGPPGPASREWGVECVEHDRNIWDIKLPPAPESAAPEGSPLLECLACHQQGPMVVTPMESEVLATTGLIARECNGCRKLTYWVYAEPARRPREISSSEPVAPPDREVGADKRAHKRLGMKLPILVRTEKNQQEIAKTENVSKGGVAVSLAMDLAVGEIISVVCPYAPGGQNIEQKAEVRWRSPFPFGDLWTYGLRYLGQT